MVVNLVLKRGIPPRIAKAAQAAKIAIEGGTARIRKTRHGAFEVIDLPSFYRAVLMGNKLFCVSHEDYNKLYRTKCL